MCYTGGQPKAAEAGEVGRGARARAEPGEVKGGIMQGEAKLSGSVEGEAAEPLLFYYHKKI